MAQKDKHCVFSLIQSLATSFCFVFNLKDSWKSRNWTGDLRRILSQDWEIRDKKAYAGERVRVWRNREGNNPEEGVMEIYVEAYYFKLNENVIKWIVEYMEHERMGEVLEVKILSGNRGTGKEK